MTHSKLLSYIPRSIGKTSSCPVSLNFPPSMMSATLFILQMEDLICNTTHKEKRIRRSFQNGLIPEKSAVSRLTTIICLRPIRSGSDLDIFKPGSGLCPPYGGVSAPPFVRLELPGSSYRESQLLKFTETETDKEKQSASLLVCSSGADGSKTGKISSPKIYLINGSP